MSAQQYLEMLQRRWRWLVAAVLVGLVLAAGSSLLATPTYRATSSLFFSLQTGNSGNDLAQGANYTQGQVASYALLARTPAVLQPVVDELGGGTTVRGLAGQVSTSVVPDTVVVEVAVSDPVPARAAELANAVAAQLVVTVEDLAPVGADRQPTVQATPVSPAVAPSSPATPRTTMDLVVGLLVGLLVGLVAVVLRDLTDTRIRTAEDLRRVTSVPLLAGLDTPPDGAGGRDLAVVTDPHGRRAEAFRSLRTSVQFLAERDRALSLVVTSSRAGEGKSTVAANLALALAEAGVRVALVDADLRRPSVATTLDLEAAAGLTTVLIGQAELDDVLQEWGPAGLHVLTTGPLPPNPSELLGSPAMASVLAELEATHDVVVLDTAPLLPVTDGVVLSRLASGTLMVVDAHRTSRAQAGAALQSLATVDSRVVGVVLTHAPQRDTEVYRYEQAPGAAVLPETPAVSPAGLVPAPRTDRSRALPGRSRR
ncbi:polysaccharide biosynthesis tyrosine autokinase [Modestobacter sp. L9-4]|jgi:succinoglycan biosynthesis transport protein ExoP|uniref:polysaccharide biosynthesis tyrosine autokinase n=1 Tax=Modestobacter sp. L9-4 TaxID=2851567 RepID=UPI001C7837CC|nr:polysaccharide biosynthesis tyrosine autokinase [Modestobacter sp. L9-4]QXG74981.1 polysaccharide biosynthesis tyrosine autokinase [Modestobacter sp. L9-4]